ncbi:MAG: sugar phosphate isomerase/epimerase [Ruminococcaceae bacterium]|nr:sugar phosphate isomerase/epimerase [Oscillospiraceae bacterium]
MKNKIAISTLRGFSVDESTKFALDCGFDGLEIQVDYLADDEKMLGNEIKHAINSGLDVSLHAPCGDINISALNKGIREESVAQVKRAIELAEKFDLRVVTFHPGRLSSAREKKSDKWSVLLDSVSKIAEYAKLKKVYVALENMELRKNELVLTIDDLNKFEEIARDNNFFGVTLDFSHFATNKIYPQYMTELKVPIYNVHISQCIASKPHYPLYEAGEINIGEVFNFLEKIDYRSVVVTELKSIFDKNVYIKSKDFCCI